jgi:hypothetical protein
MKAYLNYFAIDEARSFAIKAVNDVQMIPVQLIEYGINSLMKGIRISKRREGDINRRT